MKRWTGFSNGLLKRLQGKFIGRMWVEQDAETVARNHIKDG